MSLTSIPKTLIAAFVDRLAIYKTFTILRAEVETRLTALELLAPASPAIGQSPIATSTSAAAYTHQVGVAHTARGVVTSNVASLSAFTVASNDGLTYSAGQRVLLVGQTTGSQNGIYVVGAVSGGTAPLTRATDWYTAAVLPAGGEIMVNEGTSWANSKWFASVAGTITVGTTDPAFYPRKQTIVTGAMTAGAITVSTGWILHATKSAAIPVAKAPAGTQGALSVGTLTAGAGSGAVTITSSSNTETSTVQLVIEN